MQYLKEIAVILVALIAYDMFVKGIVSKKATTA
jgi:hypothetical protein